MQPVPKRVLPTLIVKLARNVEPGDFLWITIDHTQVFALCISNRTKTDDTYRYVFVLSHKGCLERQYLHDQVISVVLRAVKP